MKKHTTKAALTTMIALAIGLAQSTTAQAGIPVTIPATDARQIIEWGVKLEQFATEVEDRIKQIQHAKDNVMALTGVSGLGGIINDRSAKEARRYAPDTWREALIMNSLPRSASAVGRIHGALENRYQLAKPQQIDPGTSDSPVASAYKRRRDTSLATMAIAEKAYDNSVRSVRDIEQLIAAAKQASSTKAIADLTARISAETALQIAESNKLTALLLQQNAAAEAESLTHATMTSRMISGKPLPGTQAPALRSQ